MFAATVYDTYKNWSALSLNDAPLVAVGFVCAFLSALLVVRTLIGFVSRNGFAPFAWYRIALGLIMATVLFNR
jgi:undecaprenyl-diphosphatase